MTEAHHISLLDEDEALSREELAHLCRVEAAWIDELVSHGVIAPVAGTRFSAVTITTLRKAQRLEQDFALNVPGVALALDLLDEIERLRAELRRRG